mmetsp:Transcript_36599/g.80161  ORF Transcript_36599/g.80161 Transcript_36599/m.80161 type:complete len:234 (-) Transcript_36599:269-970(-)
MGGSADRSKGAFPILGPRDLDAAHGDRIDEADDRGRPCAQHQWRQPSQGLRYLRRQEDDVVAAHGANFHADSLFKSIGIVVLVVADQVLGIMVFDHSPGLHKGAKGLGIALPHEEEIDAVLSLLQSDELLVHSVLDDQLLQSEQGPSVLGALPHLHATLPGVPRVALLAVRALLVVHTELHDHGLLNDDTGNSFLSEDHFHLELLRMRLGPNETRIDELVLPRQALHVSETER